MMWFLAALFVFTFGCDQATKHYATTLPRSGVEVIPGFFHMVYAENPGVAFSQLTFLPRWSLSLVGVALMIWVCVMLWRTPREQLGQRIGYVLIIAGGLGNLVDRVRLGYVIDFILWRVKDYSWPVFNVADAAVAIGIGVLIVTAPKEKPAAAR